eukprot:431432-Prymnesium_polylepis.1
MSRVPMSGAMRLAWMEVLTRGVAKVRAAPAMQKAAAGGRRRACSQLATAASPRRLMVSA